MNQVSSLLSAIKSATTAAAIATAATAGSISLGPCFIYDQGFAQEVKTIQTGNSLATSRFIGHFDKSKTAATLSDLVHNNFGGGDFAILFE